jgi:hypothetical protein
MLKLKKLNGAPFEELVRSRVEVERQIRAHHDPRATRLTPAAYVAEAIRNARTSAQRIAELRATLEGGAPGLDNVRLAYRLLIRAIGTSPNYPWPPSTAGRVPRLSEAAKAELGTLNSHELELFAAAAATCAENAARFPAAFGEAESSASVKERERELRHRADELDCRIADAFGAADLLVDDVDAQGRARVTLWLAPAVPIYPRENLGTRLAAYLLNHP